MPNASCFLIAYTIVFGLELLRFFWREPNRPLWLWRLIIGMTTLALLTHTLYLVDRVIASSHDGAILRLFGSWNDWGILSAWSLAVAYMVLLWRRSDSLTGLFVLPLLLILCGAAIALPSESANSGASTASYWRLIHSVAMTVGTMLVTLGFAMATMYMVQSWRLKRKNLRKSSMRLPSLEYLERSGQSCVLGSAASIGFGVVSGVIMNLTQDGRVEWTDRGILVSGGLFIWLVVAAIVQWVSSKRGRGELTASMNILSFVIVAVVLTLIVSAPHGRPNNKTQSSLDPSLFEKCDYFGKHRDALIVFRAQPERGEA